MAKKSIGVLLNELTNMSNNHEMTKWAEKLDLGEHGAKAAATHIRVALAAIMKTAKALRAEIQARKEAL